MSRWERFADYATQPPVELEVVSAAAEYTFLWVLTVFAVLSTVYAIWYSLKIRSLIPVMCIVGGAMTTLLEPLVDADLQVWWPKHNQPDLFTIWGRDIPIMVIPAVIVIFGFGVLLRFHFLKQYGARSRVWLVYGIDVLIVMIMEPIAIHLNLWHYFGNHGPRFFGYPLWWPLVGGGVAACLAGTLIYKFEPYLQGWRQLLAGLILPMAVGAVYWGCSWPMFFALNAEAPTWVVVPVSALTVGMGLLVVYLCILSINAEGRRPARSA